MNDFTNEKLGPTGLDNLKLGKPLSDAQQKVIEGQLRRLDEFLDQAKPDDPNVIAKNIPIPKGKDVASLIQAKEAQETIDPDIRTQTICAANARELLILKNAGVITDEEYTDLQKKFVEKQSTVEKARMDALNEKLHGSTQAPDAQAKQKTDQLLTQRIKEASITELSTMLGQGIITEEQYETAVKNKPDINAMDLAANASTGVPVEYRNWSHAEARDFILHNVPLSQQAGLLKELETFQKKGSYYSVSIRKDNRGYGLVRFQTPNPWTNVKKEAQQSVTREIRKEVGKGTNRLINPDYSHNEVIAQYKLVRAALPADAGIKQVLDKTDSVVSAVLTSTGLAAEATNLLVNAVRGALLEAPELRYKVAALVPDDLVRQTYVATVRTAGNTIREFIHKKYHLPDRPKKTPVMVNTLDQIKPEHYRRDDAQKVGITMRDLNREDAIKFIHENVPIEKQESAIETIGRLKGNQFGVSIMDSGWVRIDASAREPRKYDDRPKYDNRQRWVGSYNATDDTKMP